MEYCTVCGYDSLVFEVVTIDGQELIKVDCNECGADHGYENIEDEQ